MSIVRSIAAICSAACALGCGEAAPLDFSDPDALGGPQEGAEQDPNLVGTATLLLATVPAGVQCLKVNATGPTASSTQNIAITAGSSSSSVALGQLPQGSVTFEGWAYDVACASIGTAAPTWIATSKVVNLAPGVISQVHLDFHRNNPVTGRISFVGNIVSLDAGGNSTYATMSDGTALWWGKNVVTAARQTSPVALTGVSSVAQVVAGFQHACYRRTTGTVWCWGVNTKGQIPGAAAGASVPTPIQVAGLTSVTQLAAGLNHTCALSSTGQVRCWGTNAEGELGQGTFSASAAPAVVAHPWSSSGVEWVRIYAGPHHTCAIDSLQYAYCWGSNAYGQLGDGTSTNRATPTGGSPPAVDISMGFQHTCIARPDGKVSCAGMGSVLGLGDSPPANEGYGEVPDVTQTFTLGGSRLSVHAAVKVANWLGEFSVLKSWGAWPGTGVDEARSPVEVPDFQDVSTITRGGESHVCMLLESQGVYCWGSNSLGQLGTGTIEASRVPVKALL